MKSGRTQAFLRVGLLGAWVWSIGASVALAQDATPEVREVTLDEALRLASLQEPTARVAHLAVERASAAERAALAALLPSLQASFAYTHWDSSVERSGLIIRNADQIAGVLSAVENLSLLSIQSERRASNAIRIASLDAEETDRRIRGQVARAFFSELGAARAVALAKSQTAIADRQHQAARARVAAGAALVIDAERAELAAIESRQRAEDALAALSRARDLLGAALGLDVPVSARATEIESPAADSAPRERSDVRAARARVHDAELALDQAWAMFVPTLGLSWNLSWNPQTTFNNPNTFQWNLVTLLTVPIFDGGNRYAALSDARASIAQARARLEATERTRRLEVRDALRRIERGTSAIGTAQRAAEMARDAMTRAETAFEAGGLTGLALDDARAAKEQAELSLLVRILDRQLAVVDLLTARGG